MHALNYHFESFDELSLILESRNDDQDLELPSRSPELRERLSDGEWVLASIAIGEETLSIAACAIDRGGGLRLSFEDRDWAKLWHFSDRSIPASIPPSIPPPESTELSVPHDAHVLIIDDDIETREVTKGLLEASGYSVLCVSSAEQAFDLMREVNIDLVLLEWALPGISGVDFCKRIRKNRGCCTLPLVFLSTRSASDDIVTAFAAGADDYVTKPFRAPELSARLIGLLRRARMPAHAK